MEAGGRLSHSLRTLPDADLGYGGLGQADWEEDDLSSARLHHSTTNRRSPGFAAETVEDRFHHLSD
jgi:hypothetical protein